MEIRASYAVFVCMALSCAVASAQQPYDYYASAGGQQATDVPAAGNGQATDANAYVDQSACTCCDDCGCSLDPWRLYPQCPDAWNFNGWINAGFVGNTTSPNSHFNGPYNAVDRANEPMMNQVYLIAEKTLPTDGCFGWGGRADVLYGEDFWLAQSVGFEKYDDDTNHWNPQYYGLAIPQLYGEVGTSDLSLKVGHFYAIVGYEGLPAAYSVRSNATNFFYTKSYSYQFAGPFTLWGGLATWNPSDAWQFQLGLTNGWDTFDAVEDNLNVSAKAKYTGESGWWTSLGVITGDDINNPGGLPIQTEFTNRTRYSWLVSLPVSCKTEYVFHQWLGSQEQGTVTGETAYWYGIDQYLYRTINDCWAAGLRFEWFRDEDGTRVGLNRPSNPNKVPFIGNFYSLTAGVNWTPTNNLTIRPEIRYDWFDGDQARQPFGDGADSTQLMLGVDAILTF